MREIAASRFRYLHNHLLSILILQLQFVLFSCSQTLLPGGQNIGDQPVFGGLAIIHIYQRISPTPRKVKLITSSHIIRFILCVRVEYRSYPQMNNRIVIS